MNFFFLVPKSNKQKILCFTNKTNRFFTFANKYACKRSVFFQLFFIADIVGSKRIPVSKFGLDLIKYSFIWLDEKFDTIRNPNSNTSSFFVSQYLMGPNSFRPVFFFSWYRSFSFVIQSNATYAFYILLNKFEHSFFCWFPIEICTQMPLQDDSFDLSQIFKSRFQFEAFRCTYRLGFKPKQLMIGQGMPQ